MINNLVAEYKQGNQEAFKEILKAEEKQIYDIIKGFYYTEKEDLYQIAMLGLVKAIKYFDESKGIKFNSFAYHCIINELNMEYRSYKKKCNIHFMSMEENIKEGEDKFTIANIITSDDNVENEVMRIIANEEIRNHIDKYAKENNIKKDVIKLSLENKYTQKAISSIVGCSRAYVARIMKDFREYVASEIA